MRLHLTCFTCGKQFSRSLRAVTPEQPHCSYRCKFPLPVPLFDIDEGSARIPLFGKSGEVRGYAIVDAADASWTCQWRWGLNNRGYAARLGKRSMKRRHFLLHRELLGLLSGDGLEGDHIDRDRLNNRRSNLRAITKAGNRQNVSARGATSSYRGVSFVKQSNKWKAAISANNKVISLGLFETELQAAEVARLAREQYMPYAVD